MGLGGEGEGEDEDEHEHEDGHEDAHGYAHAGGSGPCTQSVRFARERTICEHTLAHSGRKIAHAARKVSVWG